MIDVGSDFSGVGAFNQALNRLKIEHKHIFACDMDKYARITYAENYLTDLDAIMEKIGTLGNLANGDWAGDFYFPRNVYERKIPKESLDIYMTSPPCQAFSLAGKRKGEDDKRGILFYNSHEFITKNKPRYFIFENVKGLLSDAKGRTFQIWLDMLGGKSVNGNPVIFPREDATPYHIYYQVLNAKHYGVPQNRERVFIIGIRDDADNNFSFPKPFYLTKRLKDVLEENVDDKYFLSDKTIYGILNHERSVPFLNGSEETTNTIISGYHKIPRDGQFLKITSNTSKGYEIATNEDSINFSVPNSETRRGRVGKGVAQTLDTACNQGVIAPIVKHQLKGGKWDKTHEQSGRVYDENGISPTIHTMGGGNQEPKTFDLNQKIRKLTPRECFRLMDFPDSFNWTVSDTQAYKQAGNSIVVNVLCEILKKLNI